MRPTGLPALALALLALLGLGGCASQAPASAAPAPARVFFDDFGYADLAELRAGGWTPRRAPGHPGVAGAQWGEAQLRLLPDPEQPGNRLLRLQASTDGTPAGTRQAQLCHARKYLRGTTAARVRFRDRPVQGQRGDPVVQSFYMVSPLRYDLDPLFSELDFEYLPNGGWGSAQQRLYAVSWQTVQIEPWRAFNQAHEEPGSADGWHLLLMQVDAAAGKTRHYLDGRLLAEHGGRNQPAQPMAINFNLWFSPGGLLPASRLPRVYEQDVDWVLHVQDLLLDPGQVEQTVAALRARGVQRLDSVPAAAPPLDSPCDF